MPGVNRKIILLLKSMIVNYPILKDLGLTLPRMPVVIVEPEQSEVLMALLDDDHSKSVDEHCREKVIASILSSTYSAPIFYRYSNNGKGCDFIKELAEAVKKGSFAAEEVSGLAITVAENTDLGIPSEDVFTIFLEGDLRKLSPPDLAEVVPRSDQLSVVADRLNACLTVNDSRSLDAWKAAACFIYPCLPLKNRQTVFSGLLELADELVRQNDNAKSTEDLEELVVETISEWQLKTGFSNVVELPYFRKGKNDDLQETLFYNDDFVFLSEKLFKEIIAPLTKVYPVTVILRNLVDSLFIIPDKDSTFTAKMPYHSADGTYERCSMIRIKRSRLNRLGEPDFIDNCF